jgi:TrmH family RNA methyltransferase
VKLLTLARDLRRRKARERQGLFVAEGVRTVEELLRSPLPVRGLLVGPALAGAPRGAALLAAAVDRGLPVLEVDEASFASAADTDAPQGVLAVAQMPAHTLDAIPPVGSGARAVRMVVLDAVQDPGNVGTIIRTAAAFGATAVVALPGTVDLWNAKVVRSAMGASFRLPTITATTAILASFLRQRGIELWAADMHGEPLVANGAPAALAIAVGNEGAGLTPALREHADRLVSIPIAADVESLNVAVATGILLHSLRA